MSDCPWETDRDLFVEVMNHGRFFLNMQLFHDVRDRDQMKVRVHASQIISKASSLCVVVICLLLPDRLRFPHRAWARP